MYRNTRPKESSGREDPIHVSTSPEELCPGELRDRLPQVHRWGPCGGHGSPWKESWSHTHARFGQDKEQGTDTGQETVVRKRRRAGLGRPLSPGGAACPEHTSPEELEEPSASKEAVAATWRGWDEVVGGQRPLV